MLLELQREPSQWGATYGKLSVDDTFHCDMLEDQIRELPQQASESPDQWVARWKISGATAIPAGRYQITLDYSARFKRLMPHIVNVPGFDGIRLHSGQTAAQTEGCLLTGSARQDFGSKGAHIPGLVSCRIAFDALFEKLKAAFGNEEEIIIEVRNP